MRRCKTTCVVNEKTNIVNKKNKNLTKKKLQPNAFDFNFWNFFLFNLGEILRGSCGERTSVSGRLWEFNSMQPHLCESSERKLSIFDGKVIAVTLFFSTAMFLPEVECCKLLVADFVLSIRQRFHKWKWFSTEGANFIKIYRQSIINISRHSRNSRTTGLMSNFPNYLLSSIFTFFSEPSIALKCTSL